MASKWSRYIVIFIWILLFFHFKLSFAYYSKDYGKAERKKAKDGIRIEEVFHMFTQWAYGSQWPNLFATGRKWQKNCFEIGVKIFCFYNHHFYTIYERLKTLIRWILAILLLVLALCRSFCQLLSSDGPKVCFTTGF